MSIPQETRDKIWQEAKAYARLHRKSISGTYAQNYVAGATDWAGRAKPVIDISQEIVMLFDPTKRHVLIPADMILRLSKELAKYKEVGNG
jgi:hypothetical protein